MTAKKAAGHSAKHVSSSKHHVTSKHSPTAAKKAASGTKAKVATKGTHAKHAKAVGFAVGDLLPVCAFEAVAQSLRLAGQPVHDDEVAWLWELSGRRELSIPEALRMFSSTQRRGTIVPPSGGLSYSSRIWRSPSRIISSWSTSLILGVDVPGPHAVLATPDGWWSWGELYDPWPCTVSEAWAVSWS